MDVKRSKERATVPRQGGNALRAPILKSQWLPAATGFSSGRVRSSCATRTDLIDASGRRSLAELLPDCRPYRQNRRCGTNEATSDPYCNFKIRAVYQENHRRVHG